MEGFSQVETALSPLSPYKLERLTWMCTAWFTRCAGSYLNAKWWHNGTRILCKWPERAPAPLSALTLDPAAGAISPAKCSRSDMLRQTMGIIACQGGGRERGGMTDRVGWWEKNGRLIMYLLIRKGQLERSNWGVSHQYHWVDKTNSDAHCEIENLQYRRCFYHWFPILLQ